VPENLTLPKRQSYGRIESLSSAPLRHDMQTVMSAFSFDVKMKRPRDRFWLEQIISIIDEEIGLAPEEAAATKDD